MCTQQNCKINIEVCIKSFQKQEILLVINTLLSKNLTLRITTFTLFDHCNENVLDL